jgi:2,4-dienoyl-CoA reductase-like NADH-dependent reductase (Old Yellow Enzyme family)
MSALAARLGASIEPLFAPFTLGRLTLRNRFVMAPMTRSFSPDGVPTAEVAEYYRRRAAGHVGLVITEGTAIERPSAKNDPGVPHFYGEAALAGWGRVVAKVHAAGGVIAPQLWHVGPRLDPTITDWTAPGPVDTASGIRSWDGERLAPMTEETIADTLAAYGRAAAAAVRLGFDAVEIHGAHGYLIDDFFWHRSNLRTDRWGGATLRERARFGAEVARVVKAELPPDMPLIFRLSQWKGLDYEARVAETPGEMADWLEPLAAAGVDIFHCSQRRFWEPAIAGSDLNLAGWAKRVTGKATITVGSVGLSGEFISGGHSKPASLDELVRRFERGDFDLVAVGRALLADPDWLNKVREGRQDELSAYDPAMKKTLL